MPPSPCCRALTPACKRPRTPGGGGGGGAGGGGGGGLRHCVSVVETRGRVASLDGRHVHWVRTFRGGDRFSLIFYNTEAEQRVGELQREVHDAPG